MCRNHVTAIPAANHAQLKYFRSRDVYDTYYDEVVRLSRVGDEVVARKCHEVMVTWIKDDLEDPEGADYYHNTWSLESGFGRFCVVYGMHHKRRYGGELERQERNMSENRYTRNIHRRFGS